MFLCLSQLKETMRQKADGKQEKKKKVYSPSASRQNIKIFYSQLINYFILHFLFAFRRRQFQFPFVLNLFSLFYLLYSLSLSLYFSLLSYFFILIIFMRENRPFTQQEDSMIRELYENQNIKKWSIIARILTDDHNLIRNAKQCRDRYQQYLDPTMTAEWNSEDQQKLYRLHNEIGNKWAVIAQKFPGRTDNCVKNHFYAKLRKSLRHLNKVIKQNFKKEFKELKIGTIYKIIQALEDRFNEKSQIDQDIFNQCLRLKKELLQYANEENIEDLHDFQKQKSLIKQIIEFNRSYKRKSKKQRRNSLNGGDLFKPASIEKRVKYSSDYSSDDSEYSLAFSHKDPGSNRQKSESANSEQSEINLAVIEQDIRQSQSSKYFQPSLRFTQKMELDQDKIDIKISFKSNMLSNEDDLFPNDQKQISHNQYFAEDGASRNQLKYSLKSHQLSVEDPMLNQSKNSHKRHKSHHIREFAQDAGRNELKYSLKSNQYSIQELGSKYSLKNSMKSNNYESENLQASFKSSVEEALQSIIEQEQFLQPKRQGSHYQMSAKSESQKPDMFDDSIRISDGLRNIQEMDIQSPEEDIFLSHR